MSAENIHSYDLNTIKRDYPNSQPSFLKTHKIYRRDNDLIFK